MSPRLFLPAVLFFLALSRLVALGDRPYHHDESLFANYAWDLAARGNFHYDPLLHGPFQIQVISVIFRIARFLGVDGNGDAAGRLFAALCGIALIPGVWWGLRRWLGREGVVAAALMLCVSPGVWYYSRFCRNEAPFLLASVLLVAAAGRAWRSGRPAGGIFVSCLLAAALVAMKENSLFLLFAGACFVLLRLAHEALPAGGIPADRARGGSFRVLLGSFRSWKYAWISGLAAGWLLLEAVYSNGFVWEKSFPVRYAEILRYWWGQHLEHRLYGEFHYYLLILALYEPLVCAVLCLAVVRFLLRRERLVASALAVFLFIMGLWLGRFGDHILRFAAECLGSDAAERFKPGELLRLLHMTDKQGQSAEWHLGLALFIGWITLCATWVSLGRGRVFRAWLIWWTGLSFLQYSYAGEKVPWISLHIILPAILLTAEICGDWWRGARPPFRAAAAACFLLAVGINLFQGYRLCFADGSEKAPFCRETLVYYHTQPAIRDLGHEMRERSLESGGRAAPFLQGEALWPLLWYIHGVNYQYDREDKPPDFTNVSLLVCDPDYARDHPEIQRGFDLQVVALRQAWVPSPLHLLTPASRAKTPQENPDLYGLSAWRKLGRYVLFREMWGDPAETAIPLSVCVARRRAP